MTLRRWAKKRVKTPLQEAIAVVRDEPREVKEIVLTAAVKNQPLTALSAEAVQDELGTPEGCAFLFWLLARKHHPGITPATFREHITEETVDVVLADLLDATGLADLDPNLLRGEPGSSTDSPRT